MNASIFWLASETRCMNSKDKRSMVSKAIAKFVRRVHFVAVFFNFDNILYEKMDAPAKMLTRMRLARAKPKCGPKYFPVSM